MRKILLTSTGFSNRAFISLFLSQVDKPATEIRVIFVPTAAVFEDAREMLPYCFQDLTDAGIPPENIFTYHLGYLMSEAAPRAHQAGQTNIPPMFRLLSSAEISEFDAIYLCGGSPRHLLNEANRTGFTNSLITAVENGLFYIGVSAGSIIAAANLPQNLGFINNELSVHCKSGSPCGKLPDSGNICLTDSQAIWINGNDAEIIE